MDELISKQLKKDYLNNVDFIYVYFHGAKLFVVMKIYLLCILMVLILLKELISK